MSTDTPRLESRVLTAAHSVLWVGSLFGGGLLFLHFLMIGYLPRFDLPSVMGVIAGVAGLGLVLLVLVVVLLLLPGAAAIFFADSGAIQTVPIATTQSPLTDAEQVKARRALLTLVMGAGIAASILAVVIAQELYVVGYWLVSAAALFMLAVLFIAQIWKKALPAAGWWWPVSFHAVAYLFWWTWSVLTLSVFQASMPALEHSWLPVLWLGTIALTIHCVMYATEGAPRKLRVAVVGALVLCAFVSSSLASSSLGTVVRFFQLGMIERAQLLVTSNGCAIVKAANTSIVCQAATGGKNPVFRVGPVDIVTRVGADTLITPVGGLADRSLPRFTVPNADVMSFIIAPKSKSVPPSKNRAPGS